MNLYWNNDRTKYAVLTNKSHFPWSVLQPGLAYDERVVRYVEEHMADPGWKEKFRINNRINVLDALAEVRGSREYREFFSFLHDCGYNTESILLGSIPGLEIVWIDRGRKWMLMEADGGEEIVFEDEMEWNDASSLLPRAMPDKL